MGKGWSGPQDGSRALDGGAELATRQASAALAAGRPLRGRERRELSRQFRKEQAGRQAAAQPAGRRRPTVFEWLEKLTPEERDEFEASEKFAGFSPKTQAYVLRQRAELERAEELAEFQLASENEERSLANITGDEELKWSAAGEGEAVDWSTVDDPNAEAVDYSDDLEDGYLDEEEDE